jgi:intracellular septation protein
MKLLFDLFPVILFFIGYKLADVYVATGVAIAATFGQIAWLKLRSQRIEAMQWVGLGLIVVFGGMTLAFRDETFIKWKPTLLYLLFAAAFMWTERLTGKHPLKAMMGGQLDLPDPIWKRLTIAWVVFFVLMAGLNLLVASLFSMDTWVNFKLFGSLGLTFAFVLAQGIWISRFAKEPG